MRCYISEHKRRGVRYPITNTKALHFTENFSVYKCYVQYLRIIFHHVKCGRLRQSKNPNPSF